LGTVKTISNRTDNDAEVLDHLAFAAWKKGANAIINIKVDYKERQEGMICLTNDDEDDNIYYRALVLEGTAIKADLNSEFISKHGKGLDMAYIKDVKKKKAQTVSRKSAEAAFAIIIGAISILALN